MPEYSHIASPCFVLEEDLLRKNLQLIQQVQEKADVTIILAFKGFALWKAFPIIREYLSGASASSYNEVRLCFEEMGTKAHTYAPVYDEKNFKHVLDHSSHITFNSLSEFQKFQPHLEIHEAKISCGLRVNPEYSSVATELYNPASPTSRLGITASGLQDGLPPGIEGLHFHSLCESNSYDLEKTLNAFEERFGHLLPLIKWVNMGGGHLMTKATYDIPHLVGLLKHFREKHQVDIILEPGSAIVWETGVLVSTVLDIVENGHVKTAMLDVSFTCHMPDTLEMPYKPKVREASSELIPGKHHYRLGGTSCLAGDYMSEYSFDAPLQVGQQLLFEDMIHYTMVKTTTFNGVPHPSIGIFKSSGDFQLLKEFGYEDYRDRLS